MEPKLDFDFKHHTGDTKTHDRDQIIQIGVKHVERSLITIIIILVGSYFGKFLLIDNWNILTDEIIGT